MTSTTRLWTSLWAIRCCSDFFTAPPTRSQHRPRASFVLAMPARSAWWNALGRWPIVYSCPRLHASLLSSMSGCSSSVTVIILR
jgi:hypothetical protein